MMDAKAQHSAGESAYYICSQQTTTSSYWVSSATLKSTARSVLEPYRQGTPSARLKQAMISRKGLAVCSPPFCIHSLTCSIQHKVHPSV